MPATVGDVELFYQSLLSENGVLKSDFEGLTITSLAKNTSALELKLKAEGEPLVLENPADAIEKTKNKSVTFFVRKMLVIRQHG